MRASIKTLVFKDCTNIIQRHPGLVASSIGQVRPSPVHSDILNKYKDLNNLLIWCYRLCSKL